MKRALNIVFVLALVAGTALAQAPQTPQTPAGQAGQAAPAGRGGRGGPPPQIIAFQATPTTIRPGESFTLSWTTESGAAVIDNGIGSVYARGTIKVTPKATTTYTMSVGGTVTKSVTVTVVGTTPVAPAPAAAAAAAPRPIARLDGKPDFSGIYGFTGMAGLGRGAAGAAAPAPPPSPFANLPTNPTLKPGVQNPTVTPPTGGTADCMPLPDPPRAYGVPYPFQIFQNKNYVVIINEYPGTFRIVPIDAPHPADADPTWMGDSVGHWDGDTLVIDTIAFNGKAPIGGINKPSEKFHIIERLTRTSATGIFYEFIYEDPEIATGQWRRTQTYNADTRPGIVKIMEFICENNRDYMPLFGPAGPPPPGEGRGGRGGAAAPAAPAGGQRQ
jgi:hypothetical protein